MWAVWTVSGKNCNVGSVSQLVRSYIWDVSHSYLSRVFQVVATQSSRLKYTISHIEKQTHSSNGTKKKWLKFSLKRTELLNFQNDPLWVSKGNFSYYFFVLFLTVSSSDFRIGVNFQRKKIIKRYSRPTLVKKTICDHLLHIFSVRIHKKSQVNYQNDSNFIQCQFLC